VVLVVAVMEPMLLLVDQPDQQIPEEAEAVAIFMPAVAEMDMLEDLEYVL
jgi:hypothetical protein